MKSSYYYEIKILKMYNQKKICYAPQNRGNRTEEDSHSKFLPPFHFKSYIM